ncbi:enoyl-CoA hydratase-related protein [Dactylosporangium sp. NPDC005572]|uniref:enoyl-CoA hydratase-related protein n=1 Tax=Dactylosporangium sp. NPDC005572 TaxID=3156889 RepID=UPI0033A19C4C
MSLLVERRGAVEILTIDRPEARNALNAEVIDGLGDALERADADPDVRVLVLTAAGERAFCAGMDLAALAAGRPVVYRNFAGYQRFKREGISTPVVAAVNGAAVAGGFELVLACDLVVAAEHATFALPEVRRGLFAAGGGMLLGRRLPLAIALELGLTGAPVDARRAYELGLVNRVVLAADVLGEALTLAEAVAANGPLGVAATKRLMTAIPGLPLADAWRANDRERPAVFDSADAREGARAFLERRAPRWAGN